MQIAHLVPFSIRLPLGQPNGRYEWLIRLAKRQAARGHQVTIYAAPGSGEGLGEIDWATIDSVSNDNLSNNKALVAAAFSNLQFDIFHSHFDNLHYYLADQTAKPVVFTQHWSPNDEIVAASRFNRTGNVFAVPPTKYMLAIDKRLGIKTLGCIPHGIDLELFKPTGQSRTDRLIFVGRIAPEKGVKQAIQIAKAAHCGLDIVGKTSTKYQKYWQSLQPLIDGHQVRYLGPRTQIELAILLNTAKALLFPSQQPEAFGQVTVEAQACGTPVIISDIGPSSELVRHGITGYVVSKPADFVEAIGMIDKLDPTACHQQAKKFDLGKMTFAYEALYQQLVH